HHIVIRNRRDQRITPPPISRTIYATALAADPINSLYQSTGYGRVAVSPRETRIGSPINNNPWLSFRRPIANAIDRLIPPPTITANTRPLTTSCSVQPWLLTSVV